MIIILRFLPLLFLLLFLPFIVLCQGNKELNRPDDVETLMKSAGIDHYLIQVPEDMRNQFSNNPFGLDPDKNEKMIELFTQSFLDNRLWDDAKEVFATEFDDNYADSILSWLQNSPAQSFLDSEDEFYTIQGIRKQIVRKYELEQNPPSQERLAIIKALIDAESTNDLTIDSYATIFRAFVNAYDLFNDQQSFTRSQVNSFVSNYRQQLQSGIQEELINRHLIIYYNIEDDPLKSYTSFYRSKPGEWLRSSTYKSIQSVLEKAADQFIDSVRNSID